MDPLKILKKKPKTDLFDNLPDNIEIRWHDRNKIKDNLAGRADTVLASFIQLTSKYPLIDFFILFNKNEPKKSWYSKNLDKIVLNAAFNPVSTELQDELQKAIREY